jgi:hypothetical protein
MSEQQATQRVHFPENVVKLGGGAQFWAYISPANNTAQVVTKWSVKLEQEGGNWTGTITSDAPYTNLHTPNLSGLFRVTVTASGPNLPETQLTPQSGSNANIGCNSNCASMVGIVATPDGKSANYWTTWDAFCG